MVAGRKRINWTCRYLKTSGRTKYNRSVGEEFIHASVSESVTPAERDLIRSMSVLSEIQVMGNVSKQTVHSIIRKLSGPIGEVIEHLLLRLKELCRNPTTISNHLLNLHWFEQHLENHEVIFLLDIFEKHILRIVSTQTNNNINVVSSLRVFFWYHLLYIKNI